MLLETKYQKKNTINNKTERKIKMKNIFKICKHGIAVILALCILLSITGTCVNITAMAEDTIVAIESSTVAEKTAVDPDKTTSELMPMMAAGCSYVKFNTSMANSVAQYHGYSGAEAFKSDFGCTSNANMYRNTTTGEIVLITNTGAVIETGLYGGW